MGQPYSTFADSSMYDYQVIADAYRQLHNIKDPQQELSTETDLDELYQGLAQSMQTKPEIWH